MIAPLDNTCGACNAELPAGAVSCPACNQLVHSAMLDQLATRARWAESQGDPVKARATWEEALALLPTDSAQFKTIAAHLVTLAPPETQQKPKPSPIPKFLAPLGVIGAMLWKFKAIILIVGSKAKLIALGLFKIPTLGSMALAFGLYWSMFGWPFALGFVLSIYIHEMGHVSAMHRFGLGASAPMFIPGFGAFVRAERYPTDPYTLSRVAIAGPIWGLGAAIACMAAAAATQDPIWIALAKTGAAINLMNLIPVWILDGGQAFVALTRRERAIIAGGAGLAWVLTHEGMALIVALACVWRLFTKDYAVKGDRQLMLHFLGLIAALSLIAALPGGSRTGSSGSVTRWSAPNAVSADSGSEHRQKKIAGGAESVHAIEFKRREEEPAHADREGD